MIKDIIENNENINLNKGKIELLKQFMPNCFTKDGKLDFDLLKKELNEYVEFSKESFELNFLGKSYAKMIAGLDTETVIEPDMKHNSKEENINSENIYISGDNIDALKHLVKAYERKIKCIYIDPPYNTGSDGFVYNDTFKFTTEKLVNKLDISEEESKRILDMTSSNSSSHSAWLTFMLPRLALAHQLLSDDGIIMISIDDNEYANLKILCDTVIFGEENYIGTASWEKRTKCQNTETAKDQFQSKIEYILLYSKIPGVKHFRLLKRGSKEYDLKDEKGIYREKKLEEMSSVGIRGRETMIFPILGIMPSEGYQWKYGKDYINEFLKRDDIFEKDGKIILKIRPDDEPNNIYDPFWSHLFDKDTYGTAESGKTELKKLFGNKEIDFETVKPTKLIKNLIYHMNIENEYVLDFFSGSATTADAIYQLNAENENLNLKYILVQLPEKIGEKYKLKEQGYNTIDQFGMERIRLASNKVKDNKFDSGFKHYVLKETPENLLSKLELFKPEIVNDNYNIYKEYGVDTILETWKLKDGYEFTTNIDTIDCDGYEAYKCKECLYLINPNITVKNIQALLDKYNQDDTFVCDKLVIFGYSFRFDEIEMIKNNIKQVKNFKNIDVKVYTRY